jgi:hypothetical protein
MRIVRYFILQLSVICMVGGLLSGTAATEAATGSGASPASTACGNVSGDGLLNPVALAGPAPSSDWLYIADYGVFPNGADGVIYRTKRHHPQEFVGSLVDPVAIAFGLGHGFGRHLYAVDNNGFDIFYGAVYRINKRGTVTPFVPKVIDPTALAFSPTGPFTRGLYVGTNAAGIYWFGSEGDSRQFATMPGIIVADMAFDPSGAFGGNLIVANSGGNGSLVKMDATGSYSVFATTPPILNPIGLAFGPGGAYGTDLYVASGGDFTPGSGQILIVRPDGSVSVFASGFTFNDGPSRIIADGALAFARGHLYVSEASSKSVHALCA